MMIVLDVFVIILLFAIFGFVHSYFASLNFKEQLAHSIGEKIGLYRIFYNLLSTILLVAVLVVMPKPDLLIYDLQFPYDIIILILQYASLYGLIYTAFKINGKEFLGISQLKRYLKNDYDVKQLDEKLELRKTGIFGFVRHPIYLFSILFLGLRPYMELFYFVLFLCITTYFFIGAYYEEKKLIKIFGDEYLEYKKNVPGIFPIKFTNKKK